MSVGHIYTQHILPLLRVLTPSPVKGANTSRLVMRTRSENVCETTSAEPATKQKKHYCDYVREWRPGHRSSPTLTQPRSTPGQGKARVPVPLCSQEVEESCPSPEVRPSRGSPQDHPQEWPGPGAPLPSKREGRQTRRKEKGKKKYGRGIKSPHVALSHPHLQCSTQLWDLQHQGPERRPLPSWFLGNVQGRVRRQLFGA